MLRNGSVLIHVGSIRLSIAATASCTMMPESLHRSRGERDDLIYGSLPSDYPHASPHTSRELYGELTHHTTPYNEK